MIPTSASLFPSLILIWSIAHLVLWTLIPTLSSQCLPLDSVEAVMWGNAWQWGYDKHPPLSGWFAKIAFEAGGNAGVYFLSALCVVTAGWGLYKIALVHGFSRYQSALAVLILELIYYYQYISIEFNVNILQLPFWAWGWYFGISAARTKSMLSWCGLGLCIGLGALSKYLAVWLLVPLFCYWWRRGELVNTLKQSGLYLAAVISLLIFFPHFLWMKDHDYMTLTYGLRRAGGQDIDFITKHVWYPTEFIISQIGVLLPALLVPFFTQKFRKNHQSVQADDFDKRGLGALAWGGFLFLGSLALVFGIRPVTMWASPMPLAIGLWIIAQVHITNQNKSIPIAALICGFGGLLAVVIVYGLAPFYKNKPERLNYPAHHIAELASQCWAHETDASPLDYVIGSEWIGGIVSVYSNETPQLMIRADLTRSPALSDEMIQAKGALVLWEKSRLAHDGHNPQLTHVYPDLEKRFPQIRVVNDLVFDWPRWKGNLQGRLGIAIIPPTNEL